MHLVTLKIINEIMNLLYMLKLLVSIYIYIVSFQSLKKLQYKILKLNCNLKTHYPLKDF